MSLPISIQDKDIDQFPELKNVISELKENINYIGVSKDKTSELSVTLSEVKAEKLKFFESQLLQDLLFEVVKEGLLTDTTTKKIKNLFLLQDLGNFDKAFENYIKESESKYLLANFVRGLAIDTLSEGEINIVKGLIEKKLLKLWTQIKKFKASEPDFSTNRNDLELLKNTLLKEEQDYTNTLLNYHNLLKQLLEVRSCTLMNCNKNTILLFEKNAASTSLRSEFLENEVLQSMYFDSPNTVEALKNIDKELLSDLKKSELCLSSLKELEAQYEKVKGEEFDTILAEYLKVLSNNLFKKCILNKENWS